MTDDRQTMRSVGNGDAPPVERLAQLRRLLDSGSQATLTLATSGSSGPAKRVVLSGHALKASAAATEQVLGGPGQWLLALPTSHIAGLQVLVRSVLAETNPVQLRGRFTAATFADATTHLEPAIRRYTSLVPTQLLRCLSEPSSVRALQSFDAVLVGGAATEPSLLDQARQHRIRVVTTYGMSETCGGCVYDGRPLPGVRVRLQDGQIWLGGPILAEGYADRPADTGRAFVLAAGQRWFITGDRGAWRGDELIVLGRADAAITTGGHTVDPRPIEAALTALPEIAEAAVTGVPDAEWGQRVAALVVPAGDRPVTLDSVREALRGEFASYALPRQVETVAELPLLPTGKPDRASVRERLAAPASRL